MSGLDGAKGRLLGHVIVCCCSLSGKGVFQSSRFLRCLAGRAGHEKAMKEALGGSGRRCSTKTMQP